MTVNGPIALDETGIILEHEHVLVDFIGADSASDNRWIKDEVVAVVLPHINMLQPYGVGTFVECTPAYIGRDPLVLKALADSTGMYFVTNTGYYGAANNKFMPRHAYNETADELASRWIREFNRGIDDSGIKPGFIKIGVAPDSLSELHRKLVSAAARTHLATGLTIASHTGLALPAFSQLSVLEAEGVSSEAFIWVHAQNEKELNNHIKAAAMDAWISLDGLDRENVTEYVAMVKNMREHGLLHKVLLSHDAGWYSPGEPGGGSFRDYTVLFEYLIPLLRQNDFSEEEIDTLVKLNPRRALAIKVRSRTL
jgi:phosphotriesterase-related protein